MRNCDVDSFLHQPDDAIDQHQLHVQLRMGAKQLGDNGQDVHPAEHDGRSNVKAMQSRRGSREAYARMEARGGFRTMEVRRLRAVFAPTAQLRS
jgi:hypothetical protein